jgi:hypothetical protein
MQSSIAYVYKWTHIPSMMWYVGSRTAKISLTEKRTKALNKMGQIKEVLLGDTHNDR